MTGKKQAGKLMKPIPTVITAVLGIVLLGFLAGCADALNPPLPGGEAGTGRALVRIGPRAEGARTLMPAGYGGLSYTLTFTSGDLTVTEVLTGAETAVDLEAGAWNLSVTGDKDGTPVLEGSVENIVVQSGQTTQVSVTMKGKTGGGSGTLSYALTFPDTVIQGSLTVYGWEDGELKETVNLLEGSTPGGGKKTRVGTLALTAGYYRLDIDLESGTGVLNWSDIAHIYPGLTTTLEIEFDAGDFAVDGVSAASLAAVLEGIPGLPDGADKVYILTAGDESMPPKAIAYIGGAVTVTIDGGGRTVTLSEAGSLIDIGSGVTLKLKNLTLRGRGLDVDNNAALIKVQTGGTLELKDDAVITGNKYTTSASSRGGGVHNAGTFTMSGGKITDNAVAPSAAISSPTASSYGGGVYNVGTFTMNKGEVKDNLASSDIYPYSQAYGGGVYNAGAGTFTMNGGEITGNTASASSSSNFPFIPAHGGGVYNVGDFTMSGGKVRGNTAFSSSDSAHGGGVYNKKDFTMSGGEVTDNTASVVSLGNGRMAYGGGVYNDQGTYIMSGGAILGNTASASGTLCSAYGGGVYNNGGTYIMSGGAIAANIAYSVSSNAYGGGVHTNGGTFTKNGGTIGASYQGNGHYGNHNVAQIGEQVYVKLETGSKRRTITAGPEVNLYAKYTSGAWTFIDPATGEDTTNNWGQ